MKYLGNAIVISTLVLSTLACAKDYERTQLGFGSTKKGVEVRALLESQPVKPKAVYLWASGLTFTYRDYENKNASQFFKDVEVNKISILEGGLKGNNKRLSEFLKTTSESDFMENIELQQEARSLLVFREQIESALDLSKKGHPMIFAVEVEGERSRIEQLKEEPIVTDSIDISENLSKREKLRLKPEVFRGEYRSALINTMDASHIYGIINELVSIETSI